MDTTSLKQRLLTRLDEQRGDREPENPWLADPLPFLDFFLSPEHMEFPPLSELQKDFCAAAFPDDTKFTFNSTQRLYDVLVACTGKGSGKDSLSALITCYVVYLLLQLKDPYKFLKGQSVKGEPIDIILVAPRGRTSKKVTFEKIKQRVLNWKWLKENYKIKLSGRQITPGDREAFDPKLVEIGADSIVFPNNIRIFSLNSSQESAEGFNILVFICTEFAAFVNSEDHPNADKIYRVLYTSAKTRFAGKFIGMLISYPRYKGDPIMQKYEESQVPGSRIFGIKAPTWEFNPTCHREDYLSELESDDPKVREDARGKYLCDPGEKETSFISHFDRIAACVSGRPPIIDVEPFEEIINGQSMLRMRILKANISRQPDSRRYVARVDLGKTHDRAALAVAHIDGGKVIIDLAVHWIPDPQRKLVVDVDDAANIILWLKKNLINLVFVSYDSWNSASSINRLNRHHIVSELLSLRAEEYKLFLQHLYSASIDLLSVPALVHPKHGELAHLTIDKSTGKVDHEEGYHNDLTEAHCGVVAMLKGLKKNVDDIDSALTNVRPTLHEVNHNIWSDGPTDLPVEELEQESEDDPFWGEGVSVRLP